MPKKPSKRKVRAYLDSMNESLRMANRKLGALHPERDPIFSDPDGLFGRERAGKQEEHMIGYKIWRVKVHDDALALAHGFGRYICEAHFPDEGIAFNAENGGTAFSMTREQFAKRYQYADLVGIGETDDGIVTVVKQYLRSKIEMQGWVSELTSLINDALKEKGGQPNENSTE